jgi:hypothetical protein
MANLRPWFANLFRNGARGGIEPSPIQLKIHHFFDGDFPVYLPVDPGAFFAAGGCGFVPPYPNRVRVRNTTTNLSKSQADTSYDRVPSRLLKGQTLARNKFLSLFAPARSVSNVKSP